MLWVSALARAPRSLPNRFGAPARALAHGNFIQTVSDVSGTVAEKAHVWVTARTVSLVNLLALKNHALPPKPPFEIVRRRHRFVRRSHIGRCANSDV